MEKVNPSYCKLLSDILLRYDYFKIIKPDYLKSICKRLNYINFLLNQYYEIIFNQNLNKKQAIKKLVSIKDKQNKQILNKSDAKEIYRKFNQLELASNKGGSASKVDLQFSENNVNKTKESIIEDQDELNKINEKQRDYKYKILTDKVDYETKKKNKEKQCRVPIKQSSEQDKKQLNKLKKDKNKLVDKLNKEKLRLEDEKRDLDSKKKIYQDKIEKNIKEKSKKLNANRDKLGKIERKLYQQQNKVDQLNKDINIEKKKNKDPLINDNIQCGKNKLGEAQELMIKKNMDMMEILLICLSLLPIAGWTFDLPLFIYALLKKKYNLAIITVLNWYIWGFWLIFGLNVNMGPSMKVSYLGNKENFMKNGLLNGMNNSGKYLDPYTDVNFKIIDGKKYLTDKKGNIYEATIKNPNIIGIWDKKTNKMIKKTDPKYYDIIGQK